MTAAQDTVLRMALLSMAIAPDTPLTPAQRQWVLDLGRRTTPLTPRERVRLREPLLAWVAQRMPRVLEIVEAQFGEENHEPRPHV